MPHDPTPHTEPAAGLLDAVRHQLPAWLLAASPAQQLRLERHERQVHALEQALAAQLGDNASLLAYSAARVAADLKTLAGEALDPRLLAVTTPREVVAGAAALKWTRSVAAIAAHGLPAGDETPGSAFRTRSTLTYEGEPLPPHLAQLTPDSLAVLLAPLQLRIDFHQAQAGLWTVARQATLAQVLLARADQSAYLALLRGHLTAQAHAAWESALSGEAGKCQTVVLDNAPLVGQASLLPHVELQLNGLIVVRYRPVQAEEERFLLYASDPPGARQWWGDLDQAALETLLNGWCNTAWLKAQIPASHQQTLALALREPRWRRWDAPTARRLLQVRAQWQAGQQLALQQRLTPAWYVAAPLARRRELVRVETALQLLRDQAQAQMPIAAFEPFAREKAAALLKTLLGEDADPDLVQLTAFNRTCTFTELVIQGLQHAFQPPFDLTLVAPDELGYVHRPEHQRQVTVAGPTGLDLSPLTWDRLEQQLEGQWLADEYVAQVQARLLDSSAAGYAERRGLYVEMARQDFQRAALVGALQGSLDAGQQALLMAFTQARSGADEWVELFAVQFDLGSLVNSHQYPLLSVLPSGGRSPETVEGVWLFQAGGHALVYTPGAPDGLEFRPLPAIAKALRRQDMMDYFLARLRVKAQGWMTHQLRAIGDGAAPGPRAAALPEASLYEAFYDQPIRQALVRVAESHVGQAQALRERIERALFAVELVVMIATLPFPPAAFALGTLFALKDLTLALYAQQRGDKEAVPGHALGAALNALGALGDLAVGAKGAGTWLRLAQYRQQRQAALLPVDLRIDRRFALKQPPVPRVAVTSGLFAGTWRQEGPGLSSSYIRDEAGRWFRVQRDTDRAPLEVLRVVSAHGERKGPAVYRDGQGLWRTGPAPGLVGGVHQAPAELLPVMNSMTEAQFQHFFLTRNVEDLVLMQGMTRQSLAWVWDLFAFDRWPDLEQPLIAYMARYQRFPEWVRALQALDQAPLQIVRQRFPHCTASLWEMYVRPFQFQREVDTYERVLAMEVNAQGRTPDWLRPWVPDISARTRLDDGIRLLEELAGYQASGPYGAVWRRRDGVPGEHIILDQQLAPVWGQVMPDEVMVAVIGPPPDLVYSPLSQLNRLEPHYAACIEGLPWVDRGPLFRAGLSGEIRRRFPHFDELSGETLARLMLRQAGDVQQALTTRHLLQVHRQIQEWGAAERLPLAQPMDPLSLLLPSPLDYLQSIFIHSTPGGVVGRDLLLIASERVNNPGVTLRALGNTGQPYYVRLAGEAMPDPQVAGELILQNPVSEDVYLVLPRSLHKPSGYLEALATNTENTLVRYRMKLPDQTADTLMRARQLNRLHVIVANIRYTTPGPRIKLMKLALPDYVAPEF